MLSIPPVPMFKTNLKKAKYKAITTATGFKYALLNVTTLKSTSPLALTQPSSPYLLEFR